MAVFNTPRVQGHGTSPWKHFAGGGIAQSRHVLDWVNDGVTPPPASLFLGLSTGPGSGQGLAPLDPGNHPDFVACGNRLLKICIALEAPNYTGNPLDLAFSFGVRVPGGLVISEQYATLTGVVPNALAPSVEESEFEDGAGDPIAVAPGEGALLQLAVGGLDAFGAGQSFTFWQTCLWAVSP